MAINYERYVSACKAAVADNAVFKTFRSHPDYTPILEHVSFILGKEYLMEVQKNSPELLELFVKFITNETVGGPVLSKYFGIPSFISPTTLRYIKVLSDLLRLVDLRDKIDIVEVGIGYGGQCKIIHDVVKPKSYTLVDLPEVLQLGKKYLSNFGINKVILKTPEELTDLQYDLFISNYAFTEIDRKYQDIYVEKLIKNSANGYLTCNFLDQRKNDGALSKDEIYALKPNSTILPEKPLTAPHNSIYIWNSMDK